MPTINPQRSLDERGRLADDMFDRPVRPALRPEDHGKFVAVDIDTGDYEIDEDDYTALSRLLSRNPEAETWLMCAEYPETYKMG